MGRSGPKKKKRPMKGFSKVVFDDDGGEGEVSCGICGKVRCFCDRGLAAASSGDGEGSTTKSPAAKEPQSSDAPPASQSAVQCLRELRGRKKAGKINVKQLFAALKPHLTGAQKKVLRNLRAKRRAGDLTMKSLFVALKTELKSGGKKKRKRGTNAAPAEADEDRSQKAKKKKRAEARVAEPATDVTDDVVPPCSSSGEISQDVGEDVECWCRDCQNSFLFSAADAESYLKRGHANPVRCMECRAAKKARNQGDVNATGERTPTHGLGKMPGGKRAGVCFAYQKGRCQLGAQCRFKHEIEERGTVLENTIRKEKEAKSLRLYPNKQAAGFIPKPGRDAPQAAWDAWKEKMGFSSNTRGPSSSGATAPAASGGSGSVATDAPRIGDSQLNGRELVESRRPGEGACFAFLKGTCTRGSSCRFVHETGKGGAGKKSRPGKRERVKRQYAEAPSGPMVRRKCQDFLALGACKFGDKCRFAHD